MRTCLLSPRVSSRAACRETTQGLKLPLPAPFRCSFCSPRPSRHSIGRRRRRPRRPRAGDPQACARGSRSRPGRPDAAANSSPAWPTAPAGSDSRWPGDPRRAVTVLFQGKPETQRVALSGGRPKGIRGPRSRSHPYRSSGIATERLPRPTPASPTRWRSTGRRRRSRTASTAPRPARASARRSPQTRAINGYSLRLLPRRPPSPIRSPAAALQGTVLDAAFTQPGL